jgi:hypothetical protein
MTSDHPTCHTCVFGEVEPLELIKIETRRGNPKVPTATLFDPLSTDV